MGLNYSSNGIGVIGDAVIAIGLYIAFYYGLTGFACAWYYRKNLTSSARNLFMQGILPVDRRADPVLPRRLEHQADWDVATATTTPCGPSRASTGRSAGFLIAVAAGLVGVVFFLYCRFVAPGARVLQEADPHQGHPHPGPR